MSGVGYVSHFWWHYIWQNNWIRPITTMKRKKKQ